MNVAHLTVSVSRLAGGLFFTVRRLVAQQAFGNGVYPQILALEDDFTGADRPAWDGLAVTIIPTRGPRVFGYAPALGAELVAAAPDLVHQHGLWMYPSVACTRWAKRSGRPYLVSPRGMLDPWALRNSAWKKRLAGLLYENAHLRRAACLHALCDAEAQAIRAYGLRNPICLIPNGVDPPASLESAPPPWQDKDLQDLPVLFYLGRLHPKKNLLNLLRGWAIAQRDVQAASPWRLVICGWDQGGYEKRLRRAVGELGIADSVRLPGPVFGAAKHASFCRSNAFILPSLSEGLPVAVLEAFSYGLTVLMTEHCNIPQGFAVGAAFRIGAEPAAIADGLRKLFALQEVDRAAMGLRGQSLVGQRFSWPAVARQLKEVYEWMLGGGPPPECVIC